jgi:hypothetical protein
LRTLGPDLGARAMTETLAYVKSYLNAHRVICWLEEVIAQPDEINWFISGAALILWTRFAQLTLGC